MPQPTDEDGSGKGGVAATRLFHTTDMADAILREGFRDGHGSYGFTTLMLSGVFLARYPANINDGAKGERVLEVLLPADLDLSMWEIREDGRPCWELVVPAAVINAHGTIRELTQDEADAASPLQAPDSARFHLPSEQVEDEHEFLLGPSAEGEHFPAPPKR